MNHTAWIDAAVTKICKRDLTSHYEMCDIIAQHHAGAEAELFAACEQLLCVARLQPTPRLGEWNWPRLAKTLEAAIAKAKAGDA